MRGRTTCHADDINLHFFIMKTPHLLLSLGLALASTMAVAQTKPTFEFDLPSRAPSASPNLEPVPAKVTTTPVAQPSVPAKPLPKSGAVKGPLAATPTAKPGAYTLRVEPKEAGDTCPVKTIAMTFTNLPHATGPHTNRWLSLGCTPDKAAFMSEGNRRVAMQWEMHYNPSNDEYTLDWTWDGVGLHEESVRYHARHVFDLKVPRTLSLTDTISVTLRKVNP
jgi:hypothetical protein